MPTLTEAESAAKKLPRRKRKRKPAPASPDDLTPWEPIAKRLTLQERAFWDLCAQGMPRYQLNKRVVRFKWAEVCDWLQRTKRKGDA
jgi:hypothetical protein